MSDKPTATRPLEVECALVLETALSGKDQAAITAVFHEFVDKIDALRADLAECKALIREVEWGGCDGARDEDCFSDVCPWCQGDKPAPWMSPECLSKCGHLATCEARAILAQNEETDGVGE